MCSSVLLELAMPDLPELPVPVWLLDGITVPV